RVVSDSQRTTIGLAPATGDWVEVVDDPDIGLRIETILPRYSAITRRDPAEEEKEQVLASNVDFVGITCSVDRPVNIAKIERFLVLTQDSGAIPLLLLTKVDQGVSQDWSQLEQDIRDVAIIQTSVLTGTGLGEVQNLLSPDKTLVLLGESGVGKSSLVNELVGEAVQETTEVRSRDSKGRHTTIARELVLLPTGGALIDTPGVRGIGLWDAKDALDKVFSEISQVASNCRFSDCTHQVEPDCAIQAAIQKREINPQRLERYIRLANELDEQQERLTFQRRKSK
ncbi:MAG: ribosome small subunit-dependent GTPase A, partial [Actinomycetota bacterium]|nr:ribosome small subunit-dependent GTPase A [Actinomycetota bacterium]